MLACELQGVRRLRILVRSTDGDAWVRSVRVGPFARWDTKPGRMFGRPSDPLNWERERAQPESVYEHCETHNDVLTARLSHPHEKEEAMLTSPSVKRFVALDVHKHYVVA